MFRCHLQTTAHVLGNQFAGILPGHLVEFLVLVLVQNQIVAHATADETLLDAWQGIDCSVDLQQFAVVNVEVRADLRVHARWSLAVFACLEVSAMHTVHIGRWTAQVTQITLEVGHLDDFLDFLQNTFLAAAHHKLALMGGDGAEGAAPEAAPVHIDGELDHLVGWDGLALVLRMGESGIGQVEGCVQFLCGHERERWIHHNILAVYFLYHALCVYLVGFFLQVSNVLCLSLLVVQAFLVAVQNDVVVLVATWDLALLAVEHHLRHLVYLLDGLALSEGIGEFHDGTLAHTVEDEVGTRVAEDTLAKLVFPVVIVGDASE